MSDGKQVCQPTDSRQWKDATPPPQHCSLTHIREEVKKEGESEHRKKGASTGSQWNHNSMRLAACLSLDILSWRTVEIKHAFEECISFCRYVTRSQSIKSLVRY